MGRYDAIAAPAGGGPITGGTPYRFFLRSGPESVTTPSAGGDVDGVTLSNGRNARVACPGVPVKVEAGGSFSAGATLETDSYGRAVARTTGIGVLRALEASSAAGQIVVAIFTSGR